MAAAPVPPPIILGLIIGAAGLVLYKMVTGLATPFSNVSGVQFWHKDQADAIRQALEGNHLEPYKSVERVWIVRPGATPAPDALTAIKQIQAQKHLVTSTVNLLDKSAAERLIAEVLPAEEATLATGADLAVLPPL